MEANWSCHSLLKKDGSKLVLSLFSKERREQITLVYFKSDYRAIRSCCSCCKERQERKSEFPTLAVYVTVAIFGCCPKTVSDCCRNSIVTWAHSDNTDDKFQYLICNIYLKCFHHCKRESVDPSGWFIS